MNVLSIRNLSKSFGQQQIIKDLNMSVPEGSVFGFIGQNGAGKTTTMKMVLGLLQPDQGEILVCNEPVRFGQTKTNLQCSILHCAEKLLAFPKKSFLKKGKSCFPLSVLMV